MKWKIVGIAVAVVLAFQALMGLILSNMSLHPKRKTLSQSHALTFKKQFEPIAIIEDASVLASDRIVLRGWYVVPRHWNGRVVLLLHGLSDNRMGMVGYAEFLSKEGYSVVMPDLRAHGNSEGSLESYGFYESGDVKTWVDSILRKLGVKSIFGLGESLGAAILLQSLSKENRFSAVVAESSFCDFRTISYERIGQLIGCGPMGAKIFFVPMVETGLAAVRLMHNLDLATISPLRAVSRTRTPILFIHGLADQNIPVSNSRKLLKSALAPAELWEVANAGHSASYGRSPTEFKARVLGWFQKYAARN
jgi:dipeptidyl aminopeptidase/acylaminoacyl peptidase